MGTQVDYRTKFAWDDSTEKYELGVFNLSPKEVLKLLIKDYDIVSYLGQTILTKTPFETVNDGLMLSAKENTAGNEMKTLEQLAQNINMKKAKHEPLDNHRRKLILNWNKELLEPVYASVPPITIAKAKIYQEVYSVLGEELTIDQIIELSRYKAQVK